MEATTETIEPVVQESAKTESPTEEMVEKSKLKAALDEMHKERERARKLEEQLKSKDLSVLKEKQEWQKIAELKEKEASDKDQELTQLRSGIVYDRKFSAVREAALKSGILESALDDLEMLDFKEVAIETTSMGRINVIGADRFVSELKLKKPHWFGGKGSKVNSNSPETVGAKSITWEQLQEAEKKANKTGDYAPYEKVLRQYQLQSQ